MKIIDTLRTADLTALKKPMAVVYRHPDNLYTVRIWDTDTAQPGDEAIYRKLDVKMDEKNEIIRKIQRLSGRYSPYDVFYDWVMMMALSIQNSCDMQKGKTWREREKQYKNVITRYTGTEQSEMTAMYGLLVMALEKGISDVLGNIYMGAGCGNRDTGQFFTPFHISLACAELAVPEPDGNGKVIISEPSCGGGGMIIASAAALKKRGKDYQRILDVTAKDLDWKAVYMCYVQLSLLGIKAAVIQGSALESGGIYPPERVFLTPAKMGMVI